MNFKDWPREEEPSSFNPIIPPLQTTIHLWSVIEQCLLNIKQVFTWRRKLLSQVHKLPLTTLTQLLDNPLPSLNSKDTITNFIVFEDKFEKAVNNDIFGNITWQRFNSPLCHLQKLNNLQLWFPYYTGGSAGTDKNYALNDGLESNP